MNKFCILVPTDFSEVCQNAMIHGVELARKTNGRLLILHVINKDSKAYLSRINKGPEYINLKLKDISLQLQKSYDVQVDFISQKGSIYTTINDVAIEADAKMMVMGTHGKTGFQHLVGSAALRVISKIKIPVIVVQKRIFGDGIKKIVFPIGLDTNFLDKLDWVVEIANLFHSEVHIFQMQGHSKQIQETVSKLNQLISAKLEIENLSFKINHAKTGNNFSVQILEYAVENRADMIIMMRENNEFEPSRISINETEKLIYNTSQIPVMCINPS